MRSTIMFFILAFSINSFADYFTCRINVNKTYLEDSAEYRGRETSVSLTGYICSGKMENKKVTTIISTTYYGVLAQNEGSMSSRSVFLDYSYKGEPLDEVICECGLN